jgi:hypothetical protein
MIELSQKLNVIGRSVVTWILTAVAVIQLAAPELVSVIPTGSQADAAELVARVVAILIGSAAIIRRVMPVPETGLLVETLEEPARSDTDVIYVERGILRS